MNILKNKWVNNKESHKAIHKELCELTDSIPYLKEYRDYIEQNAYGFGERSFTYLFKMIIDEMPKYFNFLEIGVHRGAILCLVELISSKEGKFPFIQGISPMDGTGLFDVKQDNLKDVYNLFNHFGLNQRQYFIFRDLSTSEDAIRYANDIKWDIVYIDGSHKYGDVLSDLKNYQPKKDGYLIVDDCCNDLDIDGMFPGIQPVTNALNDFLAENKFMYEFLFSVVHIKVFRKVY